MPSIPSKLNKKEYNRRRGEPIMQKWYVILTKSDHEKINMVK